MYKYCATEDSVRRQRQLEACLLELMLTQNYPQITISHICDRAGVSRKSFYRYFTSKEGCLYALLDHTIFDGAAYYLPDMPNIASTRQIYERFFLYWKDNALLLDAVARQSMGQLLTERMLNHITQEEREFRYLFGEQAPESAERSIFYICGVMGLVLTWHRNAFDKSPAQMASILSDMID